MEVEVKSTVETMMSFYMEGASDIEVCKALKTTLAKFKAKYQKDAKFQELVDYGRTLSQAWWLEQARFAIRDKTFNTPMWQFVMKNRFGWAEKSETIEKLSDGSVDIDALKNKLEMLLPEMVKQFYPGLTESEVLKRLGAKN